MTAEIAILNRAGVALAADSAVTISTPTGPKIYDSVNKLFALVKQRPVGIMIYDSADLMGMPWETVIKAYRMQHRDSRFDSLKEYADDFLKFITVTPELIPFDLRDQYFEEVVVRRFACFVNHVNQAVELLLKGGGKVNQKKLRALIDDAISSEEKAWSAQPDGPWLLSIDCTKLERQNRALLDMLVSRVFQRLPILLRQRKRIRELAMTSLGKVPYWHPGMRSAVDPRSGIVIAGFGETEFFPRLLSFEISGIIDGHLRTSKGGPNGVR